MPPRGAKSQFKNYYGIFSKGITYSSLASKRKAEKYISSYQDLVDEFNL